MYIGLKNIQNLFKEAKTHLVYSDSMHCLTGWTFPNEEEVGFFPHTLYVFNSQRTKLPKDLTNAHVLYVVPESSDLDEIASKLSSDDSVLILAKDSIQEVMATLQSYFNKQCALGMLGHSMLDFLSFEDSLQSAIDHSYGVFGNPIFVFDGSYNLIAANWDKIPNDIEGQLDFLRDKKFSSNDFAHLDRDNHIHKKVLASETPIHSFDKAANTDQLICAINTQKNLGHIVISAYNRPFTELDADLLLILKKYVNEHLKKDSFVRTNRGFNHEFFLRDLLDGKITSSKSMLEKRMDYVQSDFAGTKYCFVIETARTPGTVNTAHMRNIIESRFPNSKVLIYNGQIITLIFTPSDSVLPKEYIETAQKICIENELYAGLSNSFTDIMKFVDYYKQALRAIEMGGTSETKPGVSVYADHYMDHIQALFTNVESRETFCHPIMKKLMDYDKEHKSELAKTLYTYLKCERNMAATAEAMQMHRTSLVYRFKKINDLIDNDLEDYNLRQYLILSYKFFS